MFYLDEINHTINGGGYAPEEWFHLCYKYASEAAERGYIGGYTMLGFLHFYGLGNILVASPKESFLYYQKAVDCYSGAPEEDSFYADALNNIGAAYYGGEGVARDRKKGVSLIQDAADKGNLAAQDWLAQHHDFLQKDGLMSNDEDFAYEESFDDFEFTIDAPADENNKVQTVQIDKVTKH